jgi:hypothetical protein
MLSHFLVLKKEYSTILSYTYDVWLNLKSTIWNCRVIPELGWTIPVYDTDESTLT